MKRSLTWVVLTVFILGFGSSASWALGASLNQDNPSKKDDLYKAVVQGKRSKAKKLIQAGVGLDYRRRGSSNESPLHKMANLGQVDLINPAISAGADKNAQNKKGLTPLMEAAAGGSEGAVWDLVSAGADPNLRDECGQTALMIASGLLKDEMVGALIKGGADVNAIDSSNASALVYALRYGEDLTFYSDVSVACHYKVFEPIVTISYSPELYKLEAYTHRRAEIIRLLLDAGARCDWKSKKGETVFQLARKTEGFLPLAFIKEEAKQFPAQSLADLALQGDLEKVKAEIATSKTEDEVLVAFLAAAGRGDADMVKILFPLLTSKKARNVALEDGSLLTAFEGHLMSLVGISDLGARFNWEEEPEYSLNPFPVAIFKGHLEIVKYLIDTHKNLDDFNVPILTAASRGFVEIVSFLCDAGKGKLRVGCLIKDKPVNLVREASFNALTSLGFDIIWTSPRLVGGAPPSSFGRFALGRTNEWVQLIFNALDDQRTQLIIMANRSSTVFSKDQGNKVLAELDKYLERTQ